MTRRALALALLCHWAVLAGAHLQPPALKALSAIVIDAETGRVLYTKNAKLKLAPASTTKIMTAMLLLEHCRPEEILTAPPDITKVKESSLHLMPAEQVTAEEMLYALMLRSANDGCHTVAVHIAGSEVEFAKLMNEKALQIGCEDTHFVNPHGLPDKKHLTTAYDLALMAREAMKDPAFAKVVGTQKHTIKRSLNQADTLLVNRDKFLALDPRARGVKTGYTKAAGHCFVGCATDNGMTVITAIMKSDAWLDDQKTLTNWAFDNFELRTLAEKGDSLGEVEVESAVKNPIPVVAQSDVKALVPKTGEIVVGGVQSLMIKAPVRQGQLAGYVEYYADGQLLASADAVFPRPVDARPTLAQSMTSPAALIGFMALGTGTFLMRRKSKRLSDRTWR